MYHSNRAAETSRREAKAQQRTAASETTGWVAAWVTGSAERRVVFFKTEDRKVEATPEGPPPDELVFRRPVSNEAAAAFWGTVQGWLFAPGRRVVVSWSEESGITVSFEEPTRRVRGPSVLAFAEQLEAAIRRKSEPRPVVTFPELGE